VTGNFKAGRKSEPTNKNIARDFLGSMCRRRDVPFADLNGRARMQIIAWPTAAAFHYLASALSTQSNSWLPDIENILRPA